MTSVAVLVPVLDRPARALPVYESIRASEPRAVPVFLCSPYDDAEIAACRQTGALVVVVDWQPGRGDYARKMNHGYRVAREENEWVFLAADDLCFHPGWFDACVAVHRATKACVVGTNDMGNARVVSGHHSTHTLVHADYLDCGTADDDGLILHEGYWHNYVDDEFVQTAMWRGTYAHAPHSRVEHLHPNWRKGQDDATYRRGMEHFQDDRILYESRRRLWTWVGTQAGRRRR